MTERFQLQLQVSGRSSVVPALATKSNTLHETFPWLALHSPTAGDYTQGAVRYLTESDVILARAAASVVASREDFGVYLDPDD